MVCVKLYVGTLDACLVEVKDLGVSSDQVSILPLGFFLKRTNAGKQTKTASHHTCYSRSRSD